MYLSQRELGIQRSYRDQYCLTDRNKGLPWFIFIYFLIIPPENSFCWSKLSQISAICVVRRKFIGKRDLISYNLVATIPIIMGAPTYGKKKISKKYNIGVIDLKFTQYISMMVSDIVNKWSDINGVIMTSLRHNDVIRRHDVNNWDRDMKLIVIELEVIANKRSPRFLWLYSPIMKYEVLIFLDFYI